jgi:hypothetical protein
MHFCARYYGFSHYRHVYLILPTGAVRQVSFEFDALMYKLAVSAVMGTIYFGLLVPVALLMRACGKRFLILGREPEAATYWIDRTPPGPEPSSISRQY